MIHSGAEGRSGCQGPPAGMTSAVAALAHGRCSGAHDVFSPGKQ